VNEIRESLTEHSSRVWTPAILDVGLDEIVVRTPCCYQECSLGAFHWHTGLVIMCGACGTPYDVVFDGHLDHGGHAGWAIQ
jgi:hypothetical protein